MAHPEGELATVRAAGAAGVPMILSTLSTTRVEEVAAAASGPLWFQLYIYKDRGATEALVQRVSEAGCEALVLTVDAPLLGTRERDKRNRFALPEGLSVANMDASGLGALEKQAGDSGLAAYVAELLDPALTHADLEWLRSITELPILVKGVVRADDAVRCVKSGAAGVVVSNHGGRQLDTSPATIEVPRGDRDRRRRRGRRGRDPPRRRRPPRHRRPQGPGPRRQGRADRPPRPLGPRLGRAAGGGGGPRDAPRRAGPGHGPGRLPGSERDHPRPDPLIGLSRTGGRRAGRAPPPPPASGRGGASRRRSAGSGRPRRGPSASPPSAGRR